MNGSLLPLSEIAQRCARIVIGLVRETEPNRFGGYFLAFQAKPESDTSCYEAVGFQIGIVSDKDAPRYRLFSFEKASRLHELPDDDSSWVSRDAEQERYGGAVRAGDLILSFSGLPELADEAIVLYTAVSAGLLSAGKAHGIALGSDNAHYLRLMEIDPELQPEPIEH